MAPDQLASDRCGRPAAFPNPQGGVPHEGDPPPGTGAALSGSLRCLLSHLLPLYGKPRRPGQAPSRQRGAGGIPRRIFGCDGCGSPRTPPGAPPAPSGGAPRNGAWTPAPIVPNSPAPSCGTPRRGAPAPGGGSLPARPEGGFSGWFLRTQEEFRCPHCGTLNSVYDLWCRSCGALSHLLPLRGPKRGRGRRAFWKNRPSDLPRP
jgi:hypothetical protein